MSLEKLKQIRDRAERATDGAWNRVDAPWGDGTDIYTGNGDPHSGRFVASVDPMGMIEEGQIEVHGTERDLQADADFIAHARHDVPWLCAEVKRLRCWLEILGVNPDGIKPPSVTRPDGKLVGSPWQGELE